MPVITFELFGTARLKAGTAQLSVDASTLGEAIDHVARRIPALDGSIVVNGRLHPAFRLNLNGDRFIDDPETPLNEGDALLIISADAGG